MSDSLKIRLKKMLEEGKKFTFRNSFQTWNQWDRPTSYKMDYLSWKTRVITILESQFGKNSRVIETFSLGEEISVLGNDVSSFSRSHGYFLAALSAAIELLNYEPAKLKNKKSVKVLGKKIFVVHGHDDLLKIQVESFLNEIGLEPVVLHRKADEGLTVIEKFEKHSDVGYAIILLTPDDVGYSSTEAIKEKLKRKEEFRARQNVIFEFGYFVGKLGRNKVCCLYKEGVILPSDLGGVIYKKIREDVSEIGFAIIKDLKAVGYQPKI